MKMSSAEISLFFLCCSLIYIAPTMAVGATQGSLPIKRILALSAIFALAQTGITLLGILIARWGEVSISLWKIDQLKPYAVLVLLTVLAAYMIFKVLYPEDFHESKQIAITPLKYAWLALRWFLPVLAAGITLEFSTSAHVFSILLVCACSFVISIAGLCYGYWQGYRYAKTAYAIGGGILIVLVCCYFIHIV